MQVVAEYLAGVELDVVLHVQNWRKKIHKHLESVHQSNDLWLASNSASSRHSISCGVEPFHALKNA